MLVQQSQQRHWPGGAASLAVSFAALALLVFLAVGGLSGLFNRTQSPSVAIEALADWRPVNLLEADSPQARSLRMSTVTVTLPDDSRAKLLVDSDGLPQALVFASSNVLAAPRDRVLQAGAVIADDDSFVMPATTSEGQSLDFVVKPNGEALVSAPHPQ